MLISHEPLACILEDGMLEEQTSSVEACYRYLASTHESATLTTFG